MIGEEHYFNNVVKPRLISMALDDQLPMDLHELNYEDFKSEKPQKPRTVIIVRGGIVQDIITDQNQSYLLIDYDVDQGDESDIVNLIKIDNDLALVNIMPASIISPEEMDSHFRQLEDLEDN